jgi:5-formyltetrahydrofolate cyclo-ligase
LERLSLRLALEPAILEDYRHRIDSHLEHGFPNLARGLIGLCWPFKNEYDARHLAATLRARGATTALPVVVAPRQPLEFREWHPGVAMANGVYDIPYPAASAVVIPNILLVPMNAFDRAGYRLGYGGGFFDRTLAAMNPRAASIGVAYELAAIETIRPQPYDVPMDYVVTERGLYRRDPAGLVFLGVPQPRSIEMSSPVCYADASDFGEPP